MMVFVKTAAAAWTQAASTALFGCACTLIAPWHATDAVVAAVVAVVVVAVVMVAVVVAVVVAAAVVFVRWWLLRRWLREQTTLKKDMTDHLLRRISTIYIRIQSIYSRKTGCSSPKVSD